jgi:spore coat protein H
MNGSREQFGFYFVAMLLVALCGCGPTSTVADSNAHPAYEIKISPKDLVRFEGSGFSNDTVPVTFIAGTNTYDKARLRTRGAWARGWPKKSLKVFFDKEQQFEHQRCLNLNSAWRDPAFIRELLAYHVYARCGAVASTARVVRVTMNGAFRGLYIEVEQPDKPLLERYGLKGAAIYKANSQQNVADERDLGAEARFAAAYEKETRKDDPNSDLQQFCHQLATASNVREFFEKNVDLPRYVNFLAATVLIQNWDGFNKNHFVVHDIKGAGKWLPLPWDLDRTFGDSWEGPFNEASLPVELGTRQRPGITGWNRLQDRFFSDPLLREKLLARIEELLRTEFTPEKLFPLIEQTEATIREDLRADSIKWRRENGVRGIAQLKKFITERRDFLVKDIARLRRNTPTP